MLLHLGTTKLRIESSKHLSQVLTSLPTDAEVLCYGYNHTMLLVLFNNNSSFLQYFRFEGDHGFHSINLSKDKSAQEHFLLSNGQRDSYPLHYLRSREEGLSALSYYFETEQMTPSVDWISESLWTL